MEQVKAINQDLHLYLENNTKNAGIKSLERIKRMPIKKPKKPTKKDILYHIALIRQEIFRLHEKTMLIESVINKYIKMKKEVADSIQVMTANGSAIGLNLTSCNEVLTFISLSLAIIFTIYKFTKDAKKAKN